MQTALRLAFLGLLTLEAALLCVVALVAAPAPPPRTPEPFRREHLFGRWNILWGDYKTPCTMTFCHDGFYFHCYDTRGGFALPTHGGRWEFSDGKLTVWEHPYFATYPWHDTRYTIKLTPCRDYRGRVTGKKLTGEFYHENSCVGHPAVFSR